MGNKLLTVVIIIAFLLLASLAIYTNYYHSEYYYHKICSEKGLTYGWDCGIEQNSLDIFDKPKAMTFNELLFPSDANVATGEGVKNG